MRWPIVSHKNSNLKISYHKWMHSYSTFKLFYKTYFHMSLSLQSNSLHIPELCEFPLHIPYVTIYMHFVCMLYICICICICMCICAIICICASVCRWICICMYWMCLRIVYMLWNVEDGEIVVVHAIMYGWFVVTTLLSQ